MYCCIRLEVKEPGMQQQARHCNCLSHNHGSDRKCEYTLLIVIFQGQEMSCRSDFILWGATTICKFYRHNQLKLMLNDVSETHKHLLKRVELLVHCQLMTVHTFQYRRLENGTLLHLSSIPLSFHVLQKHKKIQVIHHFLVFVSLFQSPSASIVKKMICV